MSAKQKYEWHFHNAQGAFLTTVISVSEAGARRIFRQAWGGPATCRQGDAA